jgi:methylmalonyl-CoA mutase
MQQFPKVEREDWVKRALAAAKGRPFDADAALQGRMFGPRAGRAEAAPWRIYQRIDDQVPGRALLQAQDDLANGSDGLILANADAAVVLGDLPLHGFALRNETGESGAKAILSAVQRQPIDPARLRIDFGTDDAAFARQLVSLGFAGPFVRGDGRKPHEAGATEAEEVGVALSQCVARLRKLDGLSDAQLAGAASVTLAATPSIFETIAKFRAVSILWGEILNQAKLPDRPLALHGETSRLSLAQVDAHSNILRSATAVFAAAIGGADSFSALPHSFNQGVANGFARRVARNAQLLLQHEAQLWRVSDPAGGAGAIEARTRQVCDEAWAILQRLESGEQPKFDTSRQRAKLVIGVSAYKNPVALVADVEAAL